ncbi:hypothetical protein BH23GEM9_BH23GEM9_17030 [soil metagenome]
MSTGDPILWLCAMNLAFIAALPRVFFRKGRLNLNWWFTALPFILAGVGLLWPATAGAPVRMLSTLAAVTSIALIGFTLGSHRSPVSLWHQEDDAPDRLVTHGAYAHVRHPFYAAFLLALSASLLAAPNPFTMLALLWAGVQLRRTALREEARLLRSHMGADYERYMTTTGRFLPRLSLRAHATDAARR